MIIYHCVELLWSLHTFRIYTYAGYLASTQVTGTDSLAILHASHTILSSERLCLEKGRKWVDSNYLLTSVL